MTLTVIAIKIIHICPVWPVQVLEFNIRFVQLSFYRRCLPVI